MASASRTVHKEFIQRIPKRRNRGRMVWIALALFAIVVLLGGAYYLLAVHEFFSVRRIEVGGTKLISAEFAREETSNAVHAGFNMPFLDSESIWRWVFGPRVIEDPAFLPIASRIEIRPNIWERSVAVSVTERTLSGVWCRETCYAFDERGIAFAPAPDVTGTLILKINGSAREPRAIGQAVLPDGESMRIVLQTIREVHDGGIAVSEVHMGGENSREWDVATSPGPVLQFSLEFVPKNLSGTLTNIAGRVALSTLGYLDFRVPNRVYYK